MKKTIVYLFHVIGFAFLSGCETETTINDGVASVFSNYLEENPEYKTASFTFGEMKFRKNNHL